MTWYPFYPQIALDVTGGLAAGGSGQIYATDDTTYSTPLTLRDEVGATISTVSVSSIGVTSFFQVEDHGSVMWKSGSLPAVALISAEGFLAAAQAAQLAAEVARDEADAIKDLVEAPVDAAIAGALADDTTPSESRVVLDQIITTALAGGAEIDVRSYGAVCDGLTDDTAAVQAAINAGPIVRFPAGMTTLVTYLTVPGSRTFRGLGPGAVVKHADGAATTSSAYDQSMFNITAHNSDVRFVDLILDGNYRGQGSANGGTATETTNGPVSGGVVTYGRLISANNLAPTTNRDRLGIEVDGCQIRGVQYTGIVLNAAIDTPALHLLRVTNTSFYDMAPGIVGQTYVPAHGYPSIPIGFDPSCIVVTGNVQVQVSDCDFISYRDPTVTPTSGFTTNLYNLAGNAIRVTVSGPGTTDPVPEYASLSVTGCDFQGWGRSNEAGNAIGVVDFYARARDVRIAGNSFTRAYQTAIRGKTNCQRAVISANIINGVLGGGGGIHMERPTFTAPGTAYKILSNIITNVDGVGITVIGDETMTPAYVMDVTVEGNSIAFTGDRGMFLRRIYNPKIVNNNIRNTTGIAIYADLLTGLVNVTGNTVLTSAAAGIDVGYAASSSSNKMVVAHNQVNVAVDYGITVREAYTLALDANTVANITGLSRGYYLVTVSTQCMVIGNDASRSVTTQTYNFASAVTLRELANSWNA